MPISPLTETAPIDGVQLLPLKTHPDTRGTFTELFRREWTRAIDPVQWNVVHSQPHALRGVHVHVRHADYLVLIAGSMRLVLQDLRDNSPTRGRSLSLDINTEPMKAIFIPPGVSHGFYFPVASTHIYTMSEYWNPGEEMGCHWSDTQQEFDWGFDAGSIKPMLSTRDAALPSLASLLNQMQPYQHLFKRE